MSYFLSDKEKDRILRSKGLIDKNGFPVLDPPASRNHLPKRCHDRLHKFKVDKSTFVEHDYKSGHNLYKVEKTCTVCGYHDTETRWS